MQIVIDIPEIAYNLFKSDTPIEIDWLDAENILNRIADGIVLPKGHGRLVDVKEILDAYENSYKGTHADDLAAFLSDYVQTVIPAEKGEE